MRRKIKHSKRYKDYPKNVPRKLLKLFFSLGCSVSKLASSQNVNSGIVSALLNDGKEPKDLATRVRLYLKPVTVCPRCGQYIRIRSTSKKRTEAPHIKAWRKLPAEIRNKVIEQYILFRTKQK